MSVFTAPVIWPATTKAAACIIFGRRDFQIKHMGHRVELGEIEAAAMRCDAVTRACCTFDAERQRLHLFYTGSCEKLPCWLR